MCDKKSTFISRPGGPLRSWGLAILGALVVFSFADPASALELCVGTKPKSGKVKEPVEGATIVLRARCKAHREVSLGSVEDLTALVGMRSQVDSLVADRDLNDARLDSLEANQVPCVTQMGDDVVFEGCNVHVRSGSGSTLADPNGLGNLIVGYDEQREPAVDHPKTGSHNIVVGALHSYSSYGGFVAGEKNTISGPASSVCGGFWNTASDRQSSVSGGWDNIASGPWSSVSGGSGNIASWGASSVVGGSRNVASAPNSTVSGGSGNEASGDSSSVSGGSGNEASGDSSSVSGGAVNQASSAESSVSGGRENLASGHESSVSGGSSNVADGKFASVSGGISNLATGDSSSVLGGSANEAAGASSAIVGGTLNTANGPLKVVVR